jgi:hypothetical protein
MAMSIDQGEPHLYPAKKHWQCMSLMLGFLSWWAATGGFFGFLIFLLAPRWETYWAKKVIPAFRRMMAGERRSYLRVSEKGLEYRNWPILELRCAWEDIKRIEKGRWLGDALYLQRAEQVGLPEFSVNLGTPQIPLSSLVGWSQGGLQDDLREHAPQLFRGPT